MPSITIRKLVQTNVQTNDIRFARVIQLLLPSSDTFISDEPDDSDEERYYSTPIDFDASNEAPAPTSAAAVYHHNA